MRAGPAKKVAMSCDAQVIPYIVRMAKSYLGEFEHLVLLAILRLGDAAYAPGILSELERQTGRPPSAGSVYVTLDRLEAKGLIKSRLTSHSAERGGRPRRYLALTARGVRELQHSRTSLLRMWDGLEERLGHA
jgi:PadR family transcriptional regulator PadR